MPPHLLNLMLRGSSSSSHVLPVITWRDSLGSRDANDCRKPQSALSAILQRQLPCVQLTLLYLGSDAQECSVSPAHWRPLSWWVLSVARLSLILTSMNALQPANVVYGYTLLSMAACTLAFLPDTRGPLSPAPRTIANLHLRSKDHIRRLGWSLSVDIRELGVAWYLCLLAGTALDQAGSGRQDQLMSLLPLQMHVTLP